jgi:6-phosphogluconolactonase
MEIRVAADPQAAADAAARAIARRLVNAVAARGTASVAFSGGSTPALMLARLAELDVPWAQVHVFQVDERVAPDGDPARNAGLLDSLPLRRANRHLMPVTAKDLGAAARRYAAALPERFDVVHLGVGDDGHTASWPPGDPVIDAAGTVAISQPYQGRVRMTLTPAAVNAARARVVLMAGASKQSALASWLRHDGSVPIDRVRRTGTLVVLDDAADPR